MIFTKKIAGKIISVGINNLAELADVSLFIQSGETVVMTIINTSQKKSDLGYFPLLVNYEEKFYASGKIKGSRFIRREGRASDNATLISRLIDRSIRPLFPEEYKKEVQVINTVLSYDEENSPDVLAMLGTSIALSISSVPWDGPIVGIRVIKLNNCFIINPTIEEIKKSDLDFLFSATKKEEEILINMIEVGANQNNEETILEAFDFALKEIKELFDFQEKIINKIEQRKIKDEKEENNDNQSFEKFIKKYLEERESEIYQKDKKTRNEALKQIKKELESEVEKKYPEKTNKVFAIYEKVLSEIIKKNILRGKRIDGRALDEIRELNFKTAILPRTHGSGLFSRGETRALSILTLAGPDDSQVIDGMEVSEKKSFFHHYNFPGYSVSEIRPLGWPGRREIGHGALVEKALEKIIPSEKEFPYTIRIVSEILSSSGSTSQASITAASLALMDGGVPIKEAVTGIAIGLFTDDEYGKTGNYKLVSDIQGLEDCYGEMDLKVGGTKNGITAIQMDVKNYGINRKILMEGLDLAKKNRLEILEKMRQEISVPRLELSKYAPIIKTIQVDPDRIGEIIGAGGKIINQIIKKFDVKININETGLVYIVAKDLKSAKETIKEIEGILKKFEVGEILDGKVVKILDFGAFVEIACNQSGLIHISKLSNRRVEKVEDIVKLGDDVKVKIIAIDEKDRINLQLISLI